MILRASFRVRGTRVDYSFNTVTKKHSVWPAATTFGQLSAGSPGEAIMALRPYWDNEEIRELCSWLGKLPHDW